MPNKIKICLERARKEGWALGHFNISNLETLRAIIQAAQKLKSPVAIGTSEGESKFLGLKQAAALVGSFKEETDVPLFLNLDHGKSFEYIKEAADAGYDAIHFDGSKLPLNENMEIAKKAVALARKRNILAEGEVGFIQGSSEIHEIAPEIKQEDLTDPEDALKFVKETRVDILAINIGTFHGVEASGTNPHINIQRLKEIKEKIGDRAFLVLHGGSGTPEEDIKEAIKSGINIVHVNTDLRVAYANALKESLKINPEETTPYKYMPDVIGAVQKVVEEKIKLFGSENKIC